jgi:hypothetical protein
VAAEQESTGGRLNVAALTLGLGALVTALGTFSLTGTVGRVLRNHPEHFAAGLVLLLVGAALWTIAALPFTAGRVESALTLAGVLLSVAGLVVGLLPGVWIANDIERPALTLELTDDGLRLEGKVEVANLSSDSRLVLIVDGLSTESGGGRYDEVTIHQLFVGPDSDGNVDQPIDLRLPAGLFDAVGIRSWTEPPEGDRPCETYARRVSLEGVKKAGTGCLILPLPPIPASPRLSMNWEGSAREAKRLKVIVATDNAPTRLYAREGACPPASSADRSLCPTEGRSVRVGLQVKAEARRGKRLLYRAFLRPDARGHLRAEVSLPVPDRFERICAEAGFIRARRSFATGGCPLKPQRNGRAAVELRPPRAVTARR